MVDLEKCHIRCNSEKCWTVCENYLKEKIHRSSFIKNIRKELIEKRFKKQDLSEIA